MARYLIRVKGEEAVAFKFSAASIAELRDLVDAEDDPAAFEFSRDRRDEAKRDWASLIPIGETYIPGIGSVPGVVANMDAFAAAAKWAGCGESE